jgi:hypothetical protein
MPLQWVSGKAAESAAVLTAARQLTTKAAANAAKAARAARAARATRATRATRTTRTTRALRERRWGYGATRRLPQRASKWRANPGLSEAFALDFSGPAPSCSDRSSGCPPCAKTQNCRQHRAGVGGADPPAAVAHGRGSAADGSAPRLQPGLPVAGPVGPATTLGRLLTYRRRSHHRAVIARPAPAADYSR